MKQTTNGMKRQRLGYVQSACNKHK